MASFQQPKSFLTQILEALFGGTFRAGPGPQSQPTKEELARRNHDNHVLAGKVRDLEQQIEELQHTCADLERVAMCDPLTGLYNRRGGELELGRALTPYKRLSHISDVATLPWTDVSVIIVDVNRFKEVNDTHGHSVGDKVLQAVAGHLRKAFRFDDIVIRWGGDEFTIYTIGAQQETVLNRAQEVAAALSKEAIGFNCHHATCSFGIAHGSFSTERGAHALIERLRQAADAAMYAAKQESGTGSCIATAPEMNRV